MKKIFLSDLAIGILLTVITLGAFLTQAGFFESLELKTASGEVISLKNGWGNMENSWGFII